MSVFVASHSLHSIVVDAPAFTVTQNCALDSCSGTFAVSSARLSTSTVCGVRKMQKYPAISLLVIAWHDRVEVSHRLAVGGIHQYMIVIRGANHYISDASMTTFERNLNSCTLFLEFSRNLFQSRGTGVEPSTMVVTPGLPRFA